MKPLNEKLNLLRKKMNDNEKITIAIFGLGSVGCYLLDYLVSLADSQLRIVVVGRNAEKMQQDVNIIRTAATIRGQMRSEIVVEGGCDFKDVSSIEASLRKYQPDFIVNSSRLYAGLKYGTISWTNFRAYGIWTPMSVLLGKNMAVCTARLAYPTLSLALAANSTALKSRPSVAKPPLCKRQR